MNHLPKDNGQDQRTQAALLMLQAITLSLLLTVCSALRARATDSLGTPDFVKDIQPIFQKHCDRCHGNETQESGYRLDVREIAFRGGDSGEAAIVPASSQASRLLGFVKRIDDATAMPPEGSDEEPLSASQVQILGAWIDAGAVWPDTATRELPNPLDWWSLKPLQHSSLPVSSFPTESSHAIDAFVDSKLAERGLTMSDEADSRSLCRRLYFDLIGLPPTPEQVEAFVNDSRDQSSATDVYDRLVSQLLNSPRYGERWARHWLDVVRFAESDGFETNQPRPNAWRYRDYVIDAFNSDKPYDQFVREQISGDALGADVATGFLVGGPWDRVKSPDPVLTAQQRSDELHDMVSTTGSAFLGLTIGCARCHNHKFDPISQTDYFGMVACLSGVQHGERPLATDPDDDRQRMADSLRQRLIEATTELDAFVPLAQPTLAEPRRPVVNARRNVERITPVVAKFVRFVVAETNNGSEPCLDELELWTEDGRNVALDAKATSSGDYPGNPIHQLIHLNDGQYGNAKSWIANTAGRGWVELELQKPEQLVRIIWGRDQKKQFADRLPIRYSIDVHEEGATYRTVANSDDRIVFHPDVAAFSETALLTLSPEEQKTLSQKQTEISELETKLDELTASPMAYAGRFETPSPTYRLSRGDPMQPKEHVAPAVLASIGDELIIPNDAPEQQCRVLLANWITDPSHPLTSRVLVNRLWQYHFGTGLVDTPSDLGRNGGLPSHPELLDWLASELIARGWSIKQMQRLIVTSKAYRQSSRSNSQAVAIDANNRLLWRYPPRRLEAEALRDTILCVSGQLDLRTGGPGFDLFEPNTNYVKVYETKKQFVAGDFRRMIYQNKPRVELDSLFGAFDCPDAGQIQPKRNISITPLQALNLLNSDFILEQSRHFAERIEREVGSGRTAQIRHAFQIAFNRDPSADEINASEKLIDRHGMMVFCRALYNTNEFITVL